MIKLTEKQKEKLLILLVKDEPFIMIRRELNLNKNYNLKNLCEYEGGKILKAYNLHINNYKAEEKKEIVEINENVITKQDLYSFQMNLMKEIKQNNINNLLIENCDTSCNTKYIDIISLPKELPEELKKGNYIQKQVSVRVAEKVWVDFQNFVKNNKKYNTIELLSLALFEFLTKYHGNE